MSSENRKFQRVPSRLRCWCEGENVTVYARVGNLSEGGMFLRTSTPLERGARAVLRFGAEPGVEAPATVMWARPEAAGTPAGMGLRFEELDGTRRELIKELVERELEANGAPKAGQEN